MEVNLTVQNFDRAIEFSKPIAVENSNWFGRVITISFEYISNLIVTIVSYVKDFFAFIGNFIWENKSLSIVTIIAAVAIGLVVWMLSHLAQVRLNP